VLPLVEPCSVFLENNSKNLYILTQYIPLIHHSNRQRPYHVENTGSRPITEVKQRRARSVLGWVTAWEHRVSLAFFVVSHFFLSMINFF
jgi:hypothetical protein